MMKTYRLFPFVAILALTGCVEQVAVGAAVGAGMYETRDGDLPPPDLADQIPQHQSWCYSTMTEDVECFSAPQDTPPGRLIMVDPPSAYPLTLREYQEDVAKAKLADNPPPPPPPPPVEAPPNPTIVVMPAEAPPVAAVPPPVQTPVATKPKHKHKKKPKKPVKPVPPPAVPNPPAPLPQPDDITP